MNHYLPVVSFPAPSLVVMVSPTAGWGTAYRGNIVLIRNPIAKGVLLLFQTSISVLETRPQRFENLHLRGALNNESLTG